MTIAQLLAKLRTIVLPVEHAAETATHFVEKEIAMTFDIQVISGAIARLEAKLSSSSDQSATIADLTTQLAAANADKAALLQDLTDIQTALIALSPDPAAQPAQ